MTPPHETSDPRIAEAAQLLHTYYVDGRTRTDLLKRLAEVIVDIRGSHTLADGRPDYGGRSTPYRDTVREIYRRADIAPEHLDGVQTALRYHVNNRLHELYPAEDLQAAGLSGISAKVRLTVSRELLHELNATLEDQARLAAHIDNLTEHLDPADILAGKAARAQATRRALESADARLQEVLAALDRAPRRARKAV